MLMSTRFKLGLCFSLLISNTILQAKPEYITQPILLTQSVSQQDITLLKHALYQRFPNSLEENSKNLKLISTKKSLLGTHYYFQQTHLGKSIRNYQLIVSLNAKGNRIETIYKHLLPLATAASTIITTPTLSLSEAEELAWNALQGYGNLLNIPTTDLIYSLENNAMTLVYQVKMSVSQPLGDWVFLIDAQTGQILKKHNRMLPRKPINEPLPMQNTLHSSSLKQAKEVILKQLDHQNTLLATAKQQAYVSGTAQVFDPNPKSTLADDELQDNSSPDRFQAAYYHYDLKEISLLNGSYQLIGPWVHITDFDDPTEKPSTTTNGEWMAERGVNAFNDAHTFYHVDHSQRYLQSLGFTGEKGIQMTSVGADTNGAYGWDNSYFMPEENRLSFGHGGITDSEDAETVLHEYGHAIQFGIDPNWDDDWDYGDTGAMGEGFGDYWAATYRHETKNGKDFHTNWVFVWDGHNQYWPGRVLNAFSLQYDDSKNYDAHEPLGSYSTDELWSTPLYQAYLELREQGISKADIDKIILEAHFGLGSGIKMRVMAQAIVNTAAKLFPNGPHQSVFIKHFKAMNILA